MSQAASTWYPVYIGLGSNLGGPARQIELAFGRLAGVRDSQLIGQSKRYRSAPFGGIEQPDFVNAVATLLTKLEPRELLAELKTIERASGREEGGARWGPRVIDLDLLVYSNLEISEPDLTIPHAGIAERNFVLLPLRELAPDLVIPGLGRVSKISVNENEPRIERID